MAFSPVNDQAVWAKCPGGLQATLIFNKIARFALSLFNCHDNKISPLTERTAYPLDDRIIRSRLPNPPDRAASLHKSLLGDANPSGYS